MGFIKIIEEGIERIVDEDTRKTVTSGQKYVGKKAKDSGAEPFSGDMLTKKGKEYLAKLGIKIGKNTGGTKIPKKHIMELPTNSSQKRRK